MSDGRTLRAVWSHWHNSCSEGRKHEIAKPNNRDQKETNKNRPQSDEKARHTKEKKRNGKMMEKTQTGPNNPLSRPSLCDPC